MTNHLKISLTALLLVVLISCSKVKEIENPGNVVAVTLDSLSYNVTAFENSLDSVFQGDVTGKRLDIKSSVDDGIFIISITNWQFQDAPEFDVKTKIYDTNSDGDGVYTECFLYGDTVYCDRAIGSFFKESISYSSVNVPDEPAGFVEVFENDKEARTISGNFNFIVYSAQTGEKKHFFGTFSNVEY